jgi:hypothetical protein
MFIFVRRAKAHPELDTLGGLEAADFVQTCLESWPFSSSDPWREWFPESGDGKTEFVDTWERIKRPRAVLDDAKVSAARLPLRPSRCYSVKYGLFVSVAGYLQRSVNGAILLPCRKMAALLECDAMTVSRYRRLAVQDGLLQLTARGIKAQRKADEFSFATELFDWETGEQMQSVTLNICVTSSAQAQECYTEKQDTQDSERQQDMQETKISQEMKEKKEKTKALQQNEIRKKVSPHKGPYIPTTDELARALEKTESVRRGYPNIPLPKWPEMDESAKTIRLSAESTYLP